MTKTITYGNQIIKVEIMKYEGLELWSEFILNDGARFRAKVLVREVLKAVDVFMDNGDPLYVIMRDSLAIMEIPDELKRKPDEVLTTELGGSVH